MLAATSSAARRDRNRTRAAARAQTSGSRAGDDVFVNYRGDRVFNLQVGQYDAPFTMENRTSDKTSRSWSVRRGSRVGVRRTRARTMLWAKRPTPVFYSVGVSTARPEPPNFDNMPR